MFRFARLFALFVAVSVSIMAAAPSSYGPLFPPDPWEDPPPSNGGTEG